MILLMLTSQQELAIWQPAWPTVGNDCQQRYFNVVEVGRRGIGAVYSASKGIHTVDADDFSHFGLCLFRSVQCRKRNYQQEYIAEVEGIGMVCECCSGERKDRAGESLFVGRWVVHKINNASTRIDWG